MKENKIACVTGASSGIGLSTAKKLAQEGWDLLLIARRKDRLEALKTELESLYGIKVQNLVVDIRSYAQLQTAWDSLEEGWKEVSLLINNAGLALGLSQIHNGELSDWETMIDTNIKGLLYATRLISPQMVARKSGHIVNIGSVAGKEVYPNGNVYCATKHAVDALNKAMRIDLLPFGIKVTGVHPGMLETEFSLVRFKGDKERAEAVYNNVTPLYPDDVANVIMFAVNQPPTVCLNDIVVTCTAQASAREVIRG